MKARHEFQSGTEYNEYVRLFIATMLMQGISSRADIFIGDSKENAVFIADKAVMCADALIKRLS